MKPKTNNIVGIVLIIIGMVMLVLNALDYVLGWNKISSAISAIGLMLVLIGAGITGKWRKIEKK
ncbi:MAG: hypothetical protein PHW79_02625 [Candidatus Marinimicrobia bacterium]|jgi:membrane-bound ClpP family serine protease|nr:hypothetical protein [Candidatus Neomarinimicrobiota bacterium]